MITKTNLADRKVSGHLGNQLWQIAFMIATAERADTNYFVPTNFEYKEWFPKLTYADIKSIGAYFQEPKEMARNKEIYDEYFEDTGNIVVDINGYFQCYEHLRGCEKHILGQMTPDRMTMYFKDETAIHIRGGDYKKSNRYHYIAGAEYYRDALQRIKETQRYVNPVVFTDDKELAKSIMDKMEFAYTIKDLLPTSNVIEADLYTMMDMASHKNIIACASSFSWWASFYGHHLYMAKEVFMPSRWFGKHVNIEHRGVYPPYATIIDVDKA